MIFCLLHGVQTQHLHGGQEILQAKLRFQNSPDILYLGVDRCLPQTGLEVPEDGGDGLHLLAGEEVRGPGGAGGLPSHPTVPHSCSAHSCKDINPFRILMTSAFLSNDKIC